MLLTADDLLHFQRCNRRAYLDAFGDRDRRDPPSGFLQKLMQDSQRYRRDVLSQWAFVEPDYAPGDWEAAADATEALMAEGVPCIFRGVLRSREVPGVVLVGAPHVLLRQPGQSAFGPWQYDPIDIRLGKRPKQEYQIVAAFHADLLAAVQGHWGSGPTLILRGRSPHRVDLGLRMPQMQQLLADCLEMRAERQEPEAFISRNRCSLCPWLSDCYANARAERHLSLVPGVTPNRYRILQGAGLTSLEALASAHPRRLAALPEFGDRVAEDLILQAQALRDNRAIARPGAAASNCVPGELPSADVELFFDIEAEPELGADYLHGVWAVDRRRRTSSFRAFLAEDPAEEGRIWYEFLEFMESHGAAPIFHFCAYEREAVRRLGQRYGTDAARVDRLTARFTDIHAWTVQTVVLPVEGYALKQIATYLGFDWRDGSANGAQAVYWYSQWLKTGDRGFLEAIVAYNEDDCRATQRVKDWLADFHRTQLQASA